MLVFHETSSKQTLCSNVQAEEEFGLQWPNPAVVVSQQLERVHKNQYVNKNCLTNMKSMHLLKNYD